MDRDGREARSQRARDYRDVAELLAATIQDRIAAFEMLDGMMDKTQAEKMMRLRLIGFSNAEISGMLQVSPAGVSQGLYEQRQKAAGKKRAPRKPKAATAAE